MAKRSLKERREMLGLSQAQVAKLAGQPPPDVSMAETGRDKGWGTRRVRLALIGEELKHRKYRHETARIARQRAVWNDIPDGPAKERLIELLSDALWHLWNSAVFEEADPLLFVLPDAVATKLLDDFFDPPEEGAANAG